MNCFRITEESAQAFLTRLKHRADEQTYLERAAAHTVHMRRTSPIPVPEPEVLLDAEEITRQARLRAPKPTAKPTLDDVLSAKRDAAPLPTAPRRAASGLGFRTVRGL